MVNNNFNSLNNLSNPWDWLPEELQLKVLTEVGSRDSALNLVSKDIERLMETVYTNLYREYKQLNNTYLSKLITVADHSYKDASSFQKVSYVHKTLTSSMKSLPGGNEIMQVSLFENLQESLAAQHIQVLASWHMEHEALSTFKFFEAIAKSVASAQTFLNQLPDEPFFNQVNRIKEWMRDHQPELQQISFLNLDELQLTHLPEEIQYLTGLRSLSLYNNNLFALPPEIGHLEQLRTLNVKNNQLTILPEELGSLKQLQKLELAGNQLKEFPRTIANLTQLQNLDLSYNQLSFLPEEIGSLIHLQSLYLSHNQLIALPEVISDLTQLQYLYVSENQIKNLPSKIGNLPHLKGLHLNKNKLKDIPESIGNATHLEEINLSDNQLANIPSSIGNLAKLRILDLNSNQLSTLPKELAGVTSLKKLYLWINQLQNLPVEILNSSSSGIAHNPQVLKQKWMQKINQFRNCFCSDKFLIA